MAAHARRAARSMDAVRTGITGLRLSALQGAAWTAALGPARRGHFRNYGGGGGGWGTFIVAGRRGGMNSARRGDPDRDLGGGGRRTRAATPRAGRRSRSHATAAVAVAAVALSLALAAAPLSWHDGHAPPHQPAALPAPFGAGQSHAPLHHIPWLLPAAHAEHMTPCDTTHNTGSSIESIIFVSPNGVYFENEPIVIRVNPSGTGYFSEPEDLRHTLIALETGDLDRLATYNGGDPTSSGPPHFLYNYTVQQDDFSKDLDYNATDALHWRVGTGSNLEAALGGPYNCRLPTPGTSGSLAAGGDIAVIGVPRQDAYVRGHSQDATPYGVGETVTVAVKFGETAVYSGADPGLLLNVSGVQRAAEFWTGNNSDTFLFNYTVRYGDNTGDLGYWGAGALSGSIANRTGSPLGTLPSFDTLSFLSDINFTTPPPPAAVSVSSSSPTGVYGLGETIRVLVAFSAAVNVTGTPMLVLGTDAAGGENRSAAYASGTGTRSLAFDYTVQAGDRADNLGYAGGGALSGDIVDAATGLEPAGLALPDPGGAPLSAGRPILVDHAAPVLIRMGSAVNGTDDFAGLGGVRRVSAIEADGAQYLLAGADAIQLIRVHENGTMKAADSARNGTGGFDSLGRSWGIKAFAVGDVTYAIVTSSLTTAQPAGGNDGVQLVRINGDSGTLEAAGSLKKADDASLLLDGAFSVDVVEAGIGGGRATYALVTSNDDKGAQLIRVHGDGRLEAAGSVQSDESGGSLANFTRPYTVDAFRLENGSARALVTEYTNRTLHLLGVDGTGGLEPLSQAKHNTGGFTLGRPDSVASFVQAGERRALVGGEPDYLQLVRVHDGNGTLAPVSAVRDNGPEGFAALDKPRGLAVFGAGGGTYAVSTAEDENSVQLARVGADGTLLPVDSIVAPGGPLAQTGLLASPQGVDTFSLGGRTHAAVAAAGGNSVTLIRLTLASVESVSSPNATGAHAAGSPIHVNVTFGEPVALRGDPPRLLLDAGGIPRNATYLSGNTTSSLVFNYTVLPGDNDAALGYPAVGSLSGDIRDLDGNPANPTLPTPGPAGSLPGSPPVVVDTAGPSILSVSSPNASRTYGIGSNITVGVAFSEAVTVAGESAIEIRLSGTETRDAEYSSGSGTDTLLFTYTVMQGDVSDGLNRTGSPLALGSGGSIRDAAGNDANLALPGPPGPLRADGAAIRVDGTRPAVESVSSPDAAGPYGIGSTIRVDVNFTMPVWVAGDGRPFVVLATGGTTNGSAAYASGSGEKSLRFEYTVREGDDAPRLDYAGASALVLNGSTVRDGAGNDADTALPPPTGSLLAGGAFIAADGVRPAVESVSTPNATGTYYTNQEVHIRVNFGESVTVGGGPPALSVALDAGGPPQPASARYLSGSGTDTLVFAYDVRPGDLAAALDYAGEAALDLGGGTIRDAAGNDARPGLPAPGSQGSRVASAGIAVDGTVVSVASVTSPDDDGAYAAGSRVNITVRFTEAVDVSSGTPPPSITLNAGDGARAVYRSNDGAGTLLFAYDVRPGDNAERLAYAGGLALSRGGATITAAAGGDTAHLDLPVPGLSASLSGSKAIAIDTAPPSVERVYSPNRTGTYGTGDTVHIVVLFGEDVEVSGTPLLGLETGRDAAYSSGSGTPSLLFLYTVAAGDLSDDLDYANASALRLAGGSVADPAGNAANLSLPAPGGAASLAGTSGIAVRGGTAGPGGNGGGPGPGGNGGGPGPGPGGTSMCAAYLSPPAIGFDRVEVGGQSAAVAQAVRSAGTLPIAEVSVSATGWTDGSGETVLPAGATSVLPAGAAGIWKPLGGAAVDVPVERGAASVQLRLDVPQGALQGGTAAVDASQVVTYTVSCEP